MVYAVRPIAVGRIYTTIYQALYYVKILSLGRVGLLIAKFITVGLSLVLQAV